MRFVIAILLSGLLFGCIKSSNEDAYGPVADEAAAKEVAAKFVDSHYKQYGIKSKDYYFYAWETDQDNEVYPDFGEKMYFVQLADLKKQPELKLEDGSINYESAVCPTHLWIQIIKSSGKIWNATSCDETDD